MKAKSGRLRTSSENPVVTTSVRLDRKRLNWIEAAAARKGWKPAQFVREVTVRDAIHVLNVTRQDTAPFFIKVADQIAEALADHFLAQVTEEAIAARVEKEEADRDPTLDPWPTEDWARRSVAWSAFYDGLSTAVEKGGLEFVNLLLDGVRLKLADADPRHLDFINPND